MKKRPISYTSRDFNSIKRDLVSYAERYYPTTFKDFNDASFGAMMLDMVSYVGDQLSFYVDYQANESFIDSALEYGNIVRLAKQLGFKMPGAPSSVGACAFYAILPAVASDGSPDRSYIPTLKKGTLLSSASGLTFTLNEDVFFSNPENEITVAKVNPTTGVPTSYAVKTYGQIISGQMFEKELTVAGYQRFLRLPLEAGEIIEIISVTDSQGNEYMEVENLTQDIVLSNTTNYGSDRDVVPSIMKVKPVPRRFVTEFDEVGNCFLQFGFGSSENLTTDLVADPSDVVLNVTGRNYVSDSSFDPSNLIKTDKFGVVPSDTTLTVVFRANNAASVNASVGTITSIISPIVVFKNRSTLNQTTANDVIASLEAYNEDPILGDTTTLTTEEIRHRAMSSYTSQNRAVTRSDYISLCYRMPSQFGRIKRANIIQDSSAMRRNLNLYVLSENANGDYIAANETIKRNLKVWLNQYRMLNDTIDIMDAKVINYGINFEIITAQNVNRYDILSLCITKLLDKLAIIAKGSIGEPIHVTQIYKYLNEVPGVIDTVRVEIENKSGSGYSSFFYDVDSNISDDGRYLIIPPDAAAEILFPDNDIRGVIR